MKPRLFLCLVVVSFGVASHGQSFTVGQRFCFVDEAARDSSLLAFRENLLDAVRRHDLNRLRQYVAPDIWLTEESRGFDKLREHYDLNDANSFGWRELQTVLRAACFGQDVAAHAEPSSTSRVVAKLSCDVLKPLTGDDVKGIPDAPGWTPVWLMNRERAFVRNESVVMPRLYLHIAKHGNRWYVMTLSGID
jgi:hypothetical protein